MDRSSTGARARRVRSGVSNLASNITGLFRSSQSSPVAVNPLFKERQGLMDKQRESSGEYYLPTSFIPRTLPMMSSSRMGAKVSYNSNSKASHVGSEIISILFLLVGVLLAVVFSIGYFYNLLCVAMYLVLFIGTAFSLFWGFSHLGEIFKSLSQV